MRRVQSAGRAGRRSGFTLVELVTSASLMTVLMLGVVQVFAIITQTASEAEGVHFAQQQLRAMFDRLHQDLRGMTREGYLKIRPFLSSDPVNPTVRYQRDTLAFVTIGRCTSTFASQPYEGTAAEVVYTSNVRTPNTLLKVDTAGGAGQLVDARRGILGRGQWIMAGGTGGGTASDYEDRSRLAYLCNLFTNQQQTGGGVGGGEDRITKGGQHLVVYPWTATEGLPSQHPETLKRVMASCVSEFYVEVFDSEAGGTANPGGSNQGPGTPTKYFKSLAGNYAWSWNPGGTEPFKPWPRAIRVTVAVHDPADSGPPQRYGDGITLRPFRGFALQEVFWLGDP